VVKLSENSDKLAASLSRIEVVVEEGSKFFRNISFLIPLAQCNTQNLYT
jgi:hypothetical protein